MLGQFEYKTNEMGSFSTILIVWPAVLSRKSSNYGTSVANLVKTLGMIVNYNVVMTGKLVIPSTTLVL